jgi:enoyl-CoA hydratase/carnithine racemase
MLIETSRDGRLLRLALNRPEKRNALNIALCRELIAALEAAQHDPEIGAILLSGNGKAFCAGMDLNEVTTQVDDLHDRLFTAFSWMRKPLIADVRGPAIAGGTGLVAQAHMVFASEEAIFGLTEIRIGLWPFLIFRAMVHALGERRAVELSLSGRTFSAREAEAYGLVHYVGADAPPTARKVADLPAAAIGLTALQACRGLDLIESGKVARKYRGKVFETFRKP